MIFVFANNAATALVGGIAAADTTATLADGSIFPDPGMGEQFALTFFNTAFTVWEIVYVTARDGDDITMVRAQEGTTALDWTNGSNAQELWTKGQAEGLVQQDPYDVEIEFLQLQIDGVVYVAAGSANVKTITPVHTYAAYASGQAFRIINNTLNTGNVTLQVGSLAALHVVDSNGAELEAGEWPAGHTGTFMYRGGVFIWLDAPTSVTADAASNNKRIATTEWVRAYVATALGLSYATLAEQVAGTITNKAATPEGLAKTKQAGDYTYPTAVGGTANAITLTFTPAITYSVGSAIQFMPSAANTGAVTVDGHALLSAAGLPLIAGDLASGRIVAATYDGTSLQMTSPLTGATGFPSFLEYYLGMM